VNWGDTTTGGGGGGGNTFVTVIVALFSGPKLTDCWVGQVVGGANDAAPSLAPGVLTTPDATAQVYDTD
jgi:hypothetical protein